MDVADDAGEDGSVMVFAVGCVLGWLLGVVVTVFWYEQDWLD